MAQASSPAAPALSGPAMIFAGLVLAAANFLVVLDTTIANVSVSNIAGALGVSPSQGTWVITSYAVAEAVVVPLTGWLSARFGAVKVFVAGMVGFGFFSFLCGLAPSLSLLVLFRVLQGACGGPLMPLSQTLLLRVFPKKYAAAATGLWAMTTLVAPILGPILGGTLCDNAGWAFIFWINVPVAAICGWFAWKLLRQHETPLAHAKVDLVGLGLLVVWVGALQIMVDLGKEHEWFASPLITGLAIVALLGFLAFLIWELTAADPIVDLRVFRHRGYSASVVTLSVAFGAFFGINVLTPLWLQQNMGYTATDAGYVTALLGVTAVLMAPFAAGMSTKVDPRRLVFIGLVWMGAITFMRSLATSQMGFFDIGHWLLLQGFGMPLFFVPLTGLALACVDEKETASAAGLMNFCRTLSGAIATSVVTTVWADNASRNHAALAGTLNDPQGVMDQMGASGMSSEQALGNIDQLVQGQSVMLATNQVFLAMAILFVASALIIWLAPKPTRIVDTSAVH
ncbi:DHA2 family efflux MFS transporter permease subunit [Caulobacter sp. FWC2]|uniref:DHA2 family efflux MFS transporter permease subunit n=1 Tax=Caulobacter sp. FWC2 TaxID=69664 RepID=UPI000C155410|nr:DHA2 family efflux MFS transporter permease subunit [Caulobacter sp. FWC2]PIB91787.1 MFS transporter [Caulobacter sp. FWC2]